MRLTPLERRDAFLLIEVAMTLGIVSAVLIPLIALYSLSLSILRDSNADVRSSLIAQKWIADARMRPFDQLAQIPEQWFDETGERAATAAGAYRARMEVEKGIGLFGSENVARITVHVSGPALAEREQTHSIIVANLGN